MKNVVFLGSKKIGFECLKYLYKKSNTLGYHILGVLTNNKGADILKFSKQKDLKIIDGLDNYLNIEEVIDIAISVQYHQILKKIHIEKAKDITLNLHMAPLPEYRGCNQFSFAILDEKKEFGTTIHRLEEGIDSGSILFEKRFPIKKDIWVADLHQETFNASLILFKENLKNIICGNYTLIEQEKYIKQRGTSIHYRKEIDKIKKIDLNWTKEKIERHIRATYFSGFEPPYFLINSKKIYFNINE